METRRRGREEEEANTGYTSQRGWWGAAMEQQSVCQSISGFTFLNYIMGLWHAIIVRSAFSLRYIMIHAENVIKILW